MAGWVKKTKIHEERKWRKLLGIIKYFDETICNFLVILFLPIPFHIKSSNPPIRLISLCSSRHHGHHHFHYHYHNLHKYWYHYRQNTNTTCRPAIQESYESRSSIIIWWMGRSKMSVNQANKIERKMSNDSSFCDKSIINNSL